MNFVSSDKYTRVELAPQDEYGVIIMAIGENIKRLRRDKHWTQGDLADKSGIKIGHISKLERNESDPKLSTLYKLMNALECNANSVLNDVNNTNLDGLFEMALERAQSLPEREKNILLDVIDKYCIAVSMQGLMEENSKTLFGFNQSLGKTEELSKKS